MYFQIIFPFLSWVLPLPLATLLIIVSSTSTLYWVIVIKRNVSAMGYSSQEIKIHHHWLEEVQLSHWFAVSGGEIVSWSGASCLQTFMSLSLTFDFGKNTNTLSKFVGYIDLTNFHQVLPKHSRNNEKWKCVGKFWFFTYLFLGVHLHNMPCMFLATPTLDANISTTNQNIEKPDTLSSIDAFWIRLCSHFAYAAACNTLWI